MRRRLCGLLAGVLNGLLHKQILCADGVLHGRLFAVGAIRLQNTRLDSIMLHGIENIMQAGTDGRIVNRTGNFNAAFGVARHQIGGGDIHFLLITAAEHINAGMLKKTSDNARHCDVLGVARHAGQQAADAAYDHLDS